MSTDNQPIPVAEAVAAVKAAIEVCGKATPGPWLTDRLQCLQSANMQLAVCARAGYAGTLELTRQEVLLYRRQMGGDDIPVHITLYATVAPIVQWHRERRGKR